MYIRILGQCVDGRPVSDRTAALTQSALGTTSTPLRSLAANAKAAGLSWVCALTLGLSPGLCLADTSKPAAEAAPQAEGSSQLEDQTPPSASGTPIYSVWKLLTHEQKTQYLAGYVQGWRDASRVTDIAIDFVKQNPEEAVRGLEQLKGLYDLSDVSPSLLVTRIDRYLSDSANRSASLSLAISAARNSGL